MVLGKKINPVLNRTYTGRPRLGTQRIPLSFKRTSVRREYAPVTYYGHAMKNITRCRVNGDRDRFRNHGGCGDSTEPFVPGVREAMPLRT